MRIIARTDAKPYNKLLIAPAYICNGVHCEKFNIGILMKGAIIAIVQPVL